MNSGEPPGKTNGVGDVPGADEFEQLRELLLGPEKREIADLRERVEDPAARARELSGMLPHAVRVATAKDAQLAQALGPTIESSLKESIRKDPRTLTDVVFPIIGPAIRKAISEAFNKMTQSLNQTLEHSVSVQGFKWRFEAMRTGKSFAEVVLTRTLIYRVEQVFLIHKSDGLLLEHAQAPHVSTQDADMVSGMLTAIQDFARDSLRVSQGEGLDTLRIGELNVWIESSPKLVLAAVIRGHAPEDYRTVMQDALRTISVDQADALRDFSGDAAPFDAARPALEDCLRVQLAERSGKTSPMLKMLPLILLGAILLWWSHAALRSSERRAALERERVEQQQTRIAAHRAARAEEQRRLEEERVEKERVAKYVQRLAGEEGLVVTEVTRRDGKPFVSGLRDPLAADPQTFIAGAGFAPDSIGTRWDPYYALTPGIVLKRAIQRLNPPAGVKLEMNDETLAASGSASAAWVEGAKRRVDTIPGVAAFDASGVLDVGLLALAAKKKEIDEAIVFFGEGLEITPGQDPLLQRLATQITELSAAANRAGRRLRITVTGHTTEVGGYEYNLKLSRNRADRVVSQLVLGGVDATTLVPVGFAAKEQKFRGTAEDEAKNRRVTFTASFDENAASP